MFPVPAFLKTEYTIVLRIIIIKKNSGNFCTYLIALTETCPRIFSETPRRSIS